MRRKTGLTLDLSSYSGSHARGDTPRQFALDAFNIDAGTQISEKQPAGNPYLSAAKKAYGKILQMLFGDRSLRFDPKILDARDGAYLEGFWQSEKYFKEIEDAIRKEFTLKKPLGSTAALWAEKIRAAGTSVSLHIRRGDYVTNSITHSYHGTCSKEYYARAYAEMIRRLGKNPEAVELFIFSDDIPWAKENLSFPSQIYFVSDDAIPDYEEIALMSICRHHIIANSSFSWWGAWLDASEGKIVIAPEIWNAVRGMDTTDLVPSEWIRI